MCLLWAIWIYTGFYQYSYIQSCFQEALHCEHKLIQDSIYFMKASLTELTCICDGLNHNWLYILFSKVMFITVEKSCLLLCLFYINESCTTVIKMEPSLEATENDQLGEAFWTAEEEIYCQAEVKFIQNDRMQQYNCLQDT